MAVVLEVEFGKADMGKESKELTREVRWGVLIGSGGPPESIPPSSTMVEGLTVSQGPGSPPPNAGDTGQIPGSGRSPGKRKWQATPVFLPGEFHGQRSLWATVHRVAKSRIRLSN